MLRTLVCTGVFCGLALGGPHRHKQAMTIAQMSQYLDGAAQHDSDDALARRVEAIHLSERLTPTTLSQLEESLHAGPQAREALMLLADISGFLAPPPAELPNKPAPSAAEQQAMVTGVSNFVASVIQRLPDFFAARTTESYDDVPTVVTHSGWAPVEPMHADGTFRQTITFRGGKEVTGERARVAEGAKAAGPPGLTSSGEFGPLLATILRDTKRGTIAWDHWESTPAVVAAVFRYAVPERASHYSVDFCCVKSSDDLTAYGASGMPVLFHGKPAYHGEIFVDPATNTVLRVTLEAEMKSSDPITQAGVAVDYGAVAIEGDKSYICPVHSVATSIAESYVGGDHGARLLTRVNDVTFDSYHRFGATIRMVEPSAQP
ncbi:MAG TPA: hypothetical protein VGG42_06520 [Acidobacteriaceae bacterium]